jgi:hypothetical protein
MDYANLLPNDIYSRLRIVLNWGEQNKAEKKESRP